jgi:hypothetical protein
LWSLTSPRSRFPVGLRFKNPKRRRDAKPDHRVKTRKRQNDAAKAAHDGPSKKRRKSPPKTADTAELLVAEDAAPPQQQYPGDHEDADPHSLVSTFADDRMHLHPASVRSTPGPEKAQPMPPPPEEADSELLAKTPTEEFDGPVTPHEAIHWCEAAPGEVQLEVALQEVQPEATPEEVQPEVTLEEMQPEATPEEVQPEATPEEVQPEATPEEVQPEVTLEEMQPEATPEEVQPEATPEEVQLLEAALEEVQPEAAPEATPGEMQPEATPEEVKLVAIPEEVQGRQHAATLGATSEEFQGEAIPDDRLPASDEEYGGWDDELTEQVDEALRQYETLPSSQNAGNAAPDRNPPPAAEYCSACRADGICPQHCDLCQAKDCDLHCIACIAEACELQRFPVGYPSEEEALVHMDWVLIIKTSGDISKLPLTKLNENGEQPGRKRDWRGGKAPAKRPKGGDVRWALKARGFLDCKFVVRPPGLALLCMRGPPGNATNLFEKPESWLPTLEKFLRDYGIEVVEIMPKKNLIDGHTFAKNE